MKRYIDLNGNKVEVETLDGINVVEIDGMYFEQPETPVNTVAKKENKEEKIESGTNTNLEEKAKEFLKEKKVKGYGLLKGEKLIEKAKEYGME